VEQLSDEKLEELFAAELGAEARRRHLSAVT
jgi:hypothetical protein